MHHLYAISVCKAKVLSNTNRKQETETLEIRKYERQSLIFFSSTLRSSLGETEIKRISVIKSGMTRRNFS